MNTLEYIDQTILRPMSQQLEFDRKKQIETQFDTPEALTSEFKAILLAILARRKKENLRAGLILTVSHPAMSAEEQIPYLVEHSEVPAVTIRRSTLEDRQHMYSLRQLFPSLLDAHNAIGSSFQHRSQPNTYSPKYGKNNSLQLRLL
ncbi:hypothetical protein IPG41_06705 [Candidatus Peregrinibacteria bacterium]|nr:MAG: hypothetical protein IPG41_06705 [Candidatus Peregrinibacteria bacterium]